MVMDRLECNLPSYKMDKLLLSTQKFEETCWGLQNILQRIMQNNIYSEKVICLHPDCDNQQSKWATKPDIPKWRLGQNSMMKTMK